MTHHTWHSLHTETKLNNYTEQGSHTLVDTIEQKWFEIIKEKKYTHFLQFTALNVQA